MITGWLCGLSRVLVVFDHFDSVSVALPDAPRPHELLMACAITVGSRPNARSGTERINTDA